MTKKQTNKNGLHSAEQAKNATTFVNNVKVGGRGFKSRHQTEKQEGRNGLQCHQRIWKAKEWRGGGQGKSIKVQQF